MLLLKLSTKDYEFSIGILRHEINFITTEYITSHLFNEGVFLSCLSTFINAVTHAEVCAKVFDNNGPQNDKCHHQYIKYSGKFHKL